MADGSVVIDVVLDTAAFNASVLALETQINSLGSSLMQSFTGMSGFDAAAETMFAGIAESISAMGSLAAASASEMVQAAMAAVQNADWSSAGHSAASSVASGIESGGGDVISAAGSVAASASQAFSSGSWSSIGYNIMSGVADGIRSAGNSVIAAIQQVSKETKEAVEKYYKISSPSALMRDEVGIMISRGIAEGITDGSVYVKNAMAEVSDKSNAYYMAGYGKPELSGKSDGFGTSSEALRGGFIQNIYLRDSDNSPYETARAIRRESEAMLRL